MLHIKVNFLIILLLILLQKSFKIIFTLHAYLFCLKFFLKIKKKKKEFFFWFFRENRLGIDLVQDNVEVELRKEIKTIGSSEMILQRTLEQVDEIMRELRAALFLLDRDLEDKLKVLNIERDCLNLKTTDLNLSTYHGTTPLNVS